MISTSDLPCLPQRDLPCMCASYPKKPPKFLPRGRIPFVDTPNGFYELIRIASQVAAFTMLQIKARRASVVVVFLVGRPLQILDSIVRFVAILVVHGPAILGIFQKRLRDYAMHQLSAFRVERHGVVAIFAQSSAYHTAAQHAYAPVFVGHWAGKAANTAKIRNLITPNKTQNGPPNLFHFRFPQVIAMFGIFSIFMGARQEARRVDEVEATALGLIG